ncbi:unnamed protein product [Rotaria magnacalcarata]|uniref:Cilia- and flagella-associated protein HOATZ n=1 Tax=Rotaria magnacalcarata TaxID=392030 RepID=A0A819BH26_9BILA|nr:unnamed protein product [Rotaria magnacalcarata]CAF2187573.1 unnamed protein product [Rotaria magnacalcarata]CAF3798117.1 unnamed protein product [Rotaria magnacalcarata]CAF3884736.1 unnamed protein product [Rotaria magnacalcarata]
MNLQSSKVHEIDTRNSTALTVFDGSREDESKLAKQFWNSVVLIPPVESTLVCKEINQRTRTRTLDDGIKKSRFFTTISKNKKEKTLKEKFYDETAVYQLEEDEARRIKAFELRHQKVRQLFYKQAKTNRIKNEQWAISSSDNYLMNIHHEGASMSLENETDDTKYDENERELVFSLPD